MERLLLMFMLYSIIGWFYETSTVSIKNKKFINRGFLHGPFIPIYGFAIVTFMVSIGLIEPYLPQQIVIKAITMVIYIGVVASLWEYITSALLEKIFHTRWWDYSNRKFNLKGRIALDCSILWGVGGYILWRFVNTPLVRVMESLPKVAGILILTIFYSVIIIDSILTIRELLTLKQILDKLEQITDQLSDKVLYNIEQLNEEIEEGKEKIKLKIDEHKKTLEKTILQLTTQKEAILDDGQDTMLENFNSLLERSKKFSRLFQSYPAASSKKFKKIVPVVRYKRHEK